MKLSDAQTRFLAEAEKAGDAGIRTPFTGGPNAGRVASAWYRTAHSLERLGLIGLVAEGDATRAFDIRPSPTIAAVRLLQLRRELHKAKVGLVYAVSVTTGRDRELLSEALATVEKVQKWRNLD